jgi:hypothetical protein
MWTGGKGRAVRTPGGSAGRGAPARWLLCKGNPMTEVLDQATSPAPTDNDLGRVVHHVLARSDEPLTLSKIRSHLPTVHRSVSVEELTLVVERLAEANVFYRYPPYRSQHHRYWDRAMPEHIRMLIRKSVEEEPLTRAQLRRKLPSYAQDKAAEILADLLAQGLLHWHPPAAARSGERYGVRPPDPRAYLRKELPALFARLEQELRVSQEQLRQAAIELLHEEEWDPTPAGQQAAPAAPPAPAPTPVAATAATEEPAAPPPVEEATAAAAPPEPAPVEVPPEPVAAQPSAAEPEREQPAPADGTPPVPVAPAPAAVPANEDTR